MLDRWSIIKLSLTLSIGIASVTGDKLISIVKEPLVRALCDNVTHAIVAALSWTLTIILSHESIVHNLMDIALCLLISSLIDLDHFMAAHSWKLDDATRLDKRPFLHLTTIPILLWSFLMLMSTLLENAQIEKFSWIILTSFMTHHIRDGTRRGLWLAPFGSTRPIPYHIYIIASMLFPYAVYFSMTRNSAATLRPFRGARSIV